MRFSLISLTLLLLPARVAAQCSTTGRLVLNATATRTAAATAPSCSLFTGGVVVFNTSDVNLNGWDTIDGDLEVYQYSTGDVTYIHSTTLRNISGQLQLRSYDPYFAGSTKLGIVNISFPALEYVGQLNVGGKFYGVSLEFGKNTTTEVVRLTGSQGGGSAAYYTLYLNVSTVRGQIPYSKRVSDEDLIANNESGYFFSNASSFNASVTIRDNKFATITMPKLEDIQSLSISKNTELEKIDIAVAKVGSLRVTDNGRETSAIFDNLTTLGAYKVYGSTFSNLVSLRLPRLREVNNSDYTLSFSENLFPELNLTSLEKANTTLQFYKNTVLADLHLPRLVYAKKLDVEHNPRLLNFRSNTLRRVDDVLLEGNFTNVELFSITEVTGNFKVIGSPSMDCSWFDENFFQKVVKGTYQCVGNHTKPLVPRRPSTPTELEEVDSSSPGSGASPSVTPILESGSVGLSTGTKAGIGAGVGAGAIILLGIGALLWWRKKKTGSPAEVEVREENAELGDTSDSKVLGGFGEVQEKETRSSEKVELDTKTNTVTEMRHELGDEETKSDLEQGAITGRSELP